MKVINLLGGPCTGKSTTMHGLMYFGKIRGLRIECSVEYAREIIYQGKHNLLQDGLHILEEQERRLRIYEGQGLDAVICEAPFIHAMVYNTSTSYSHAIRTRTLNLWNQYHNTNYLFCRNKSFYFDTAGRLQKETSEALAIDNRLRTILAEESIPYTEVESNQETIHRILDYIII
jgi:nicotinamide riboside kinase